MRLPRWWPPPLDRHRRGEDGSSGRGEVRGWDRHRCLAAGSIYWDLRSTVVPLLFLWVEGHTSVPTATFKQIT